MEAKRSVLSKLALVAAAGLFAGATVGCQSNDGHEANGCDGNACDGNKCDGNACDGNKCDGNQCESLC
jgi:hypothetical protein